MLIEKRTASALVALIKRIEEKRDAILPGLKKWTRDMLEGQEFKYLIVWSKESPEEGFERYYKLSLGVNDDFHLTDIGYHVKSWDDVEAVRYIDPGNALTLAVPSTPLEHLAHALKQAEGRDKWSSIVEGMYGYRRQEQIKLQEWLRDLKWVHGTWGRRRVVLDHLSTLLRHVGDEFLSGRKPYNGYYSSSNRAARERIYIDDTCLYWDVGGSLQVVDTELDLRVRGDAKVFYTHMEWIKGKTARAKKDRMRAKTCNIRDYVERLENRRKKATETNNNNDNGK